MEEPAAGSDDAHVPLTAGGTGIDIGVITVPRNRLEEARESERRKSMQEKHLERAGPVVDLDASAPVVARIAILRSALDELEIELSAGSIVAQRSDGTVEPS